ncbi:MAG: DUF2203 domain-containing protein [Blastocatellia bacterium]|nr:DUF2203 domain-containing protein [Blastocatellia bacterium]
MKLFSVEEANRLIPELQPLVRQVAILWQNITDLQPEIQLARNNAEFGGGSPVGAYYIEEVTTFLKAVNRVEKRGVLIKDYKIGLCDFPHLRDGRIIYLCWKMDEDLVHYWHEVDAGFSGRQPL